MKVRQPEYLLIIALRCDVGLPCGRYCLGLARMCVMWSSLRTPMNARFPRPSSTSVVSRIATILCESGPLCLRLESRAVAALGGKPRPKALLVSIGFVLVHPVLLVCAVLLLHAPHCSALLGKMRSWMFCLAATQCTPYSVGHQASLPNSLNNLRKRSRGGYGGSFSLISVLNTSRSSLYISHSPTM